MVLSDRITLCDCPGLVFPTLMRTKAEMVVNGVLPLDQLREHIRACRHAAHHPSPPDVRPQRRCSWCASASLAWSWRRCMVRVAAAAALPVLPMLGPTPRLTLPTCAAGLRLPLRLEDGAGAYLRARDMLQAYSTMRGFMASGHAGPDEPRGARCVLRDYVTGRLLVHCHPPPGMRDAIEELRQQEVGRPVAPVLAPDHSRARAHARNSWP